MEMTRTIFGCKTMSPNGLHVRRAGILARGMAEAIAGRAVTAVMINESGKQRRVDSILDVMNLGVAFDSPFTISIEGECAVVQEVQRDVEKALLSMGLLPPAW